MYNLIQSFLLRVKDFSNYGDFSVLFKRDRSYLLFRNIFTIFLIYAVWQIPPDPGNPFDIGPL